MKRLFTFTWVLCMMLGMLPGCAQKEKSETLDGKRVLFVGDSFLFSGKAVLTNKGLTQQERHKDQGYFYQICKANGMEVDVINFTYGGQGLSAIHRMYMPTMKDRNVDYVILSGGRNSANTYADLSETLDKYIEMFRSVNPNVKFVYLVTSGAHNISVKESFPKDVLNNLKAAEEKGITIVDWGKLVADIIRGEVTVPGGTQTYNNHTFVKNKSTTDGYHPNQLTGYITAQMIFCAITGKSAVGQSYAFWNDASLSTQFDPERFMAEAYTLGSTNYPDVFASEADMQGIQQLIDQYLAAKHYREYHFT